MSPPSLHFPAFLQPLSLSLAFFRFALMQGRVSVKKLLNRVAVGWAGQTAALKTTLGTLSKSNFGA